MRSITLDNAKGLTAWAEQRGLQDLQVHVGPVAVTASCKVTSVKDETQKQLGHLAGQVLAAMRYESLMLPLLLLVEPPGDQVDELIAWSQDQEWHQGAFTLYPMPADMEVDRLRSVLCELEDPEDILNVDFRSPIEVLEEILKPLVDNAHAAELLKLVQELPASEKLGDRVAQLVRYGLVRRSTPPGPEDDAGNVDAPVKPFHGPVHRVVGARLSRFRGWTSDATTNVDLDADVVLLAGSNGLGKSSLMEALTLMLALERVHRPPTGDQADPQQRDLGSRDPSGQYCDWTVSGDVQTKSVRTTLQSTPGRHDPAYEAYVRSRMRLPNGSIPTKLVATCTYITAEDTRRTLDDGALQDQSVLRYIAAAETLLAEVAQGVARGIDGIGREVRDLRSKLDAPYKPQFLAAADGFRVAWNSWLQATGHFARSKGLVAIALDPELPDLGLGPLVAALADNDWMSGGSEELLVHQLSSLEGGLRKLEADLPRIDEPIQEVAEERRELEDALAPLRDKWPRDRADQVVAWAEGPVAIDRLLASLEEKRLDWLQGIVELGRPRALQGLATELEQIDIGALRLLRDTVGAFVGQAREAQRLYRALEDLPEVRARSMDSVFVALEMLRTQAGAEDTRRAEVREAAELAARAQEREADAAEWRDIEECLNAGRGTEYLAQALTMLEQQCNTTMRRFPSLAEHLPVSLRTGPGDRHLALRTKSGLDWSHLSSGQKGQAALGLLLSQARLLHAHMPHRVLVLDDIAGFFDIGNIVPLATWIRQLAYGEDDEQRYQVIFAIADEHMLTQLGQLLVPPQGRTMKLVQFKAWSPETGPTIETYQVPPAEHSLHNLETSRQGSLTLPFDKVWTPLETP